MSTLDYIKSYMVKVGVDVDKVSFGQFDSAINSTEKKLEEFTKKAEENGEKISKFQSKLFSLIKGFGKLSTAMVTASVGIGKFIQNTAESDMEMQKLARRLYISTDRAKALQNTLDAMNLSMSDLQDVAYNPELLAQYKELFTLAKSFKAPRDLNTTFREVRSIFREFQKFNLTFQVFKERVAYFIYKVVQGPARAFKKWFSGFNNNFAMNLDKWANKLGTVLGMVTRLTMRAAEAIINGISKIAKAWSNLWNSLPEGIKKLALVGGAISILSRMGPMGALLGVTTLYDDYKTFKEGGESNNFLKPIWRGIDKIISCLEELINTIKEFFEKIKNSRLGKLFGLGRDGDTFAGSTPTERITNQIRYVENTSLLDRLLSDVSGGRLGISQEQFLASEQKLRDILNRSPSALEKAMVDQSNKSTSTTNQTFNFTITGQSLNDPQSFLNEVSSLIRNNQGVLVGE